MPLATVHVDIAPIYTEPSQESYRLDEVLYGMSVQVLENSERGWCYARTEYGTEGFMLLASLNTDFEVASAWHNYKKQVVLAPYIDVLAADTHDAPRIASLPRGGLLVALGRPLDDAWQKVGLATGKKGFTRLSYIAPEIQDWSSLSEEDMRWNLVETALSYNGSSYRAGGRTPLGIDNVGLVAMTYLLNGVIVEQAVSFTPGKALRRIRFEAMQEGDVLYFEDSLGIYIGENRFVHATEYPGNEGVVVSSLRPRDDDYRPDLADHIQGVASLY